MAREFSGNHFAMSLIRIIVWHHLYLFPVDYKHKQFACEKLHISLESRAKLLAIEQKKTSAPRRGPKKERHSGAGKKEAKAETGKTQPPARGITASRFGRKTSTFAQTGQGYTIGSRLRQAMSTIGMRDLVALFRAENAWIGDCDRGEKSFCFMQVPPRPSSVGFRVNLNEHDWMGRPAHPQAPRPLCWVVRAASFLKSGLALTPGSDPESASRFLRGASSQRPGQPTCLWPAAVRTEELAVALSATPNSTSSNARSARPRQAPPRHIPGSI